MRWRALLLALCLPLGLASAAGAEADTAGAPPAIRLPGPQYETGLAQAARFFDGFQWNGDLRVRYDGMFDDTTNKTVNERERGRFSVRLGFTKKINARALVGFQLATGVGANPASTFQSFDNAATGKTISISQAYIDYVPIGPWSGFHTIVGKMPKPFNTTSLVWDADVAPEGAVETFKLKRGSWEWWGTGAQFFLEDNAAKNDPYMLGGQVGFIQILSADRGVKWSLAAAQYHFLRPYNIDATVQSPSNFASGQHVKPSGYSILDISGAFEMTLGRALPLRLSGGYINNLSAEPTTVTNRKENTGWVADLQLGKITDAGTWEIGGGYRYIRADAALGQFTESEFASSYGNTDVQGWTVRAGYSPFRNLTWSVSGYHTRPISNRSFIPKRNRVETTLGAKF